MEDRTQATQVGPHIPETTFTTCGVLEGSVLEPLLFILYINDIYTCLKELNFCPFADDTMLYATKTVSHQNIQ